MKIKFLFLLLFFSCLKLFSQMHEFAPVGAKWRYDYDRIAWTGYMQLEVIDDTTINFHTYKIISKTEHMLDLSVAEHPLLVNFIGNEFVRQEDETIIYLSDGNEYVLYEFGTDVGDIWTIDGTIDNDFFAAGCDTNGIVEKITSSDTVLTGILLKKFTTQHEEYSGWTFHNYEIIEKIGSLYYLFPDVSECVSTTENFTPGPLRCYQDDELGLLKFSETDCEYIYLDIEYILYNDLSIYPNPAIEKIYLQSNTDENIHILFSDITGKKIDMPRQEENDDLFVADISLLPSGIYFVTIYSYDRKIIGTQKIIKQ